MRIIKRPMKAIHFDEKRLKFPIYASAKIDGLRCIHSDGEALSSTFKPIRNRHVCNLISDIPFNDLDGEIVSSLTSFRSTISDLTSFDGKPDFVYYVFDYVRASNELNDSFSVRYNRLCNIIPLLPPYVHVLPQLLIFNMNTLLKYEEEMINNGAEGLVLRSPASPYKFGRSTLNEGYMLKVKRYVESYAFIIGIVEQAKNLNDAEIDNFGLTTRSHVSINKEGKDTMGALIVQDCESKQKFKIGSGLNWTIEFRNKIWDEYGNFHGRKIKYKYFPVGEYEKPRHPTMLEFAYSEI